MQIAVIQMKGVFWMADQERAPADAVLVCVVDAIPEVVGVVLARVQWVMVAEDKDMLISRSEGPFDMGTALDYAEEIAELYGYSRVVVAISDQALWQGEWGTLSGPPGAN
jgi:hypothetical protein